ncbi:MAG: cysteine--tRNA ligase, partial [Chlamydiia bacterium]|nr:cysteine--tRNA ligase [Chlamydiia bacterium]
MTGKQKIPSLQLFNTLTRKKEPFKTLREGVASVYTCGPTVYNFAHIGNYRTYVFEDLLRRTLEYFGFQVNQVMNLTDVDDKTIRGAIQKGCTLDEYTKPYKEAFFADEQTLGIERVEHYPKATQYISQMIALIQKLMDKGVAYLGKDGSVYFSIAGYPEYGKLSHLPLEELRAGASNRVDSDEYEKGHVGDFVLWKGYDAERDGSIYWESPFGKGRPGWHLECSTMAMEILGETIDLHIGGVDNMFPHHENEIAQSEAATGCCFSPFWMHSEHLVVEGRKMAKSAGNFFTLRDLLDKGYTGREVRYLLLQAHYRTQLNFTFAGLEGARASLQRIDACVRRLRQVDGEGKEGASQVEALITKTRNAFESSLADDLNISAALAALYDCIHDTHAMIDGERLGKRGAEEILHLIEAVNRVLGVLEGNGEDESVPDEVVQAVAERTQARQTRDWARADALRDQIARLGFTVEDTR